MAIKLTATNIEDLPTTRGKPRDTTWDEHAAQLINTRPKYSRLTGTDDEMKAAISGIRAAIRHADPALSLQVRKGADGKTLVRAGDFVPKPRAAADTVAADQPADQPTS